MGPSIEIEFFLLVHFAQTCPISLYILSCESAFFLTRSGQNCQVLRRPGIKYFATMSDFMCFCAYLSSETTTFMSKSATKHDQAVNGFTDHFTETFTCLHGASRMRCFCNMHNGFTDSFTESSRTFTNRSFAKHSI